MDKSQLNQEIIFCRSLVKRAKVCIIRKLIKKIKILRTCKNDDSKEKKYRKARRLTAELHVMKTLRPDYVTKFALITENYVPTGSNTRLKRKRNACAKLTKHKDLVKKINSIREKFTNWREELPALLERTKKTSEENETTADKSDNDPDIPASTIVQDVQEQNSESENHENISRLTEDNSNVDSEPESKSRETLSLKIDKPAKAIVPKSNLIREDGKNNNNKRKRKKANDLLVKGQESQKENNDEVEDSESKVQDKDEVVEEKMDDPFFVGKKILVPKLLQKGNEDHPENKFEKKESNRKKHRDDIEKEFKTRHNEQRNQKPVKREIGRTGKIISDDELHPSWKAKKIQMIKPFEGKKIRFDEIN